MVDISRKEWDAMTWREQTVWLEINRVARKGSISCRGFVKNVGVNDARYSVSPRVGGTRVLCKAYDCWSGMLRRAYSSELHEKFPTYRGVKVCDEWLMFSVFRLWWLDNQVDGYELDKDLVGDGSVYSPQSCVFIPSKLNTFTINHGADRGEYPIGVSYNINHGKYWSSCSNPITGKREFLGLFCCQEDAHAAWMKRKLSIAIDLKGDMDAIDKRIYDRVVSIIESAR